MAVALFPWFPTSLYPSVLSPTRSQRRVVVGLGKQALEAAANTALGAVVRVELPAANRLAVVDIEIGSGSTTKPASKPFSPNKKYPTHKAEHSTTRKHTKHSATPKSSHEPHSHSAKPNKPVAATPPAPTADLPKLVAPLDAPVIARIAGAKAEAGKVLLARRAAGKGAVAPERKLIQLGRANGAAISPLQ